MNFSTKIFSITAVIIGGFIIVTFLTPKTLMAPKTLNIQTIKDLVSLFPHSAAEVNKTAQMSREQSKRIMDNIVAIPNEKRTFANTIYPLDRLFVSQAMVTFRICEILEQTSPDEAVRNACHQAVIDFKSLWIDLVDNNEQLYKAVVSYMNNTAEQLTDEQRYAITQMIKDWERNGLNLPAEKRAQIAAVKKELAELTTNFDRNIAADSTIVTFSKEELQGLDDDFFAALQRSDDGRYSLRMDYPTVNAVLERCSVAATREKMYKAFSNRAYPINKQVLQDIAAKRDELAQLLGFPTYAALDLDNQMVKNPERAHQFLSELRNKSMPKAKQEFEQLITDLPASVKLNDAGQMQPWDGAHTRYLYKQKHFNIDEFKLAEYFPMEHTVERLFDIYRAFFGLDFKNVSVKGLWYEDVQVLQVSNVADGKFLGYLVLDLYPRPNKYSHACMAPLVSATFDEQGNPNGAVAMVIANFSKPTATKPSLLKRKEVETFFHEFGHALHELLGRTNMAMSAGVQVKTDFVELPSQMLEEWLIDPAILKMVSHHYQTGEPLSDETIKKIVELKQFSTGSWLVSQLLYSEISLAFFEQALMDFDAALKQLKEINMPFSAYSSDDHMYANFGHLTGYGAKYYGYLWSKVFALDLFEKIKQAGLLNGEMGQKYIDAILSKGGSADPNELLYNFLGRAPTEDAFVKEMGL